MYHVSVYFIGGSRLKKAEGTFLEMCLVTLVFKQVAAVGTFLQLTELHLSPFALWIAW
jgi:hypothetical protein